MFLSLGVMWATITALALVSLAVDRLDWPWRPSSYRTKQTLIRESELAMRTLVLWLLGVPVLALLALNVFGFI
jgi:hypothetical protein